MRSKIVFLTFIAVSLLCAYFVFFLPHSNVSNDPLLIHDNSRLKYVRVHEVVHISNEHQIVEALGRAKREHLKVTIGGARHSQGGQILYPNSLFLDMQPYHRILSINPKAKTIRVQPGATWADIQDYANPYHLSVKVMQSSNIFTVGGSLSANVHGRDIRFGPLIQTINSFHLLQPDGSIVNVSRTEHPELFRLAIGGYGLFGVILDVELQLTDDVLYRSQTDFMDYKQYENYFRTKVLHNPDVQLHFGRLSTAPQSFLTEMYATNYIKDNDSGQSLKQYMVLQHEQHIARNKFIFGLSRKYDWAKNMMWDLEKYLSRQDDGKRIIRNNAMRPDIDFLEYDSPDNTDILQEYFVPLSEYKNFVDDLRSILQKNHVNLLNITVRYVRKQQESLMSYAKDDMFALVLYINQGFSEQQRRNIENVIRAMVGVTLKHNGTYYLPYQLYPTEAELRKSYTNTDLFFSEKKKYDPTELFMNEFYEKYGIKPYNTHVQVRPSNSRTLNRVQ